MAFHVYWIISAEHSFLLLYDAYGEDKIPKLISELGISQNLNDQPTNQPTN
jgi:hypothetical protein